MVDVSVTHHQSDVKSVCTGGSSLNLVKMLKH